MTTCILDADDVLFDFIGPAKQLLEQLGKQVVPGEELFASRGDKVHFAEAVDAKPGWVRDLPLKHGAFEAIQDLRALGVEVVVATRPLRASRNWYNERVAALLQYYSFTSDELYFCKDKSRIQGDLFVDNLSTNVHKWQLAHQKGVGILWDYPENAAAPLHHQSMRTSDWAQVISVAKQFLYYEQGAR